MSEADAKLAYADKAIKEAEAMASELKKFKAQQSGPEPVAMGAAAHVAASNSDDAIKADWDANRDGVQAKFTKYEYFRAYRKHNSK
jgi:hypothetical protein